MSTYFHPLFAVFFGGWILENVIYIYMVQARGPAPTPPPNGHGALPLCVYSSSRNSISNI